MWYLAEDRIPLLCEKSKGGKHQKGGPWWGIAGERALWKEEDPKRRSPFLPLHPPPLGQGSVSAYLLYSSPSYAADIQNTTCREDKERKPTGKLKCSKNSHKWSCWTAQRHLKATDCQNNGKHRHLVHYSTITPCLIYFIWSPPNSPSEWCTVIITICRLEHSGLEMGSEFPKVSEHGSGRARVDTYLVQIQNMLNLGINWNKSKMPPPSSHHVTHRICIEAIRSSSFLDCICSYFKKYYQRDRQHFYSFSISWDNSQGMKGSEWVILVNIRGNNGTKSFNWKEGSIIEKQRLSGRNILVFTHSVLMWRMIRSASITESQANYPEKQRKHFL